MKKVRVDAWEKFKMKKKKTFFSQNTRTHSEKMVGLRADVKLITSKFHYGENFGKFSIFIITHQHLPRLWRKKQVCCYTRNFPIFNHVRFCYIEKMCVCVKVKSSEQQWERGGVRWNNQQGSSFNSFRICERERTTLENLCLRRANTPALALN